ncbi:MAG: UDP-2,3-diacylglucosamine diphosphatase [Gammaproteobacteria bacterium]|nr:UDP-2,3-diacylglucosamine diphosphatase [Gammaproteobacteria bacterium]
MKPILFISDLHLSPERPDIIQLFQKFLTEKQNQISDLYILGDFVEYWLGDDDKAEGLNAAFDSLKIFSDNGHNIFLMHGNRDFLMGQNFADRCGCTLIQDPFILNLNSDQILLMHGDTLCTDDTRYQMFRSMVRNPDWQSDFLSKSLEERTLMAQAMRETSKEETKEKSDEIMDVNQQTVEKTFIENNTRMIIHGHTHRPDIHKLDISGTPGTRIVLGDWYKKGSYLEFYNTDNFTLKDYY